EELRLLPVEQRGVTEVYQLPVVRRGDAVGADRRALGDAEAVIGLEVLEQPRDVACVARARVLDRGLEIRNRVSSVQQPKEFPYGRSGGPVEAEGEDLLGRGIEATEPQVGHRRRLPGIQGILPLERAVRSPPTPDVSAQMRARLDQFSVGVFQA